MPPLLTQVARLSDGLPLVAIQTPAPGIPVTSRDQKEAKDLLRKITVGYVNFVYNSNHCQRWLCGCRVVPIDRHGSYCVELFRDIIPSSGSGCVVSCRVSHCIISDSQYSIYFSTQDQQNVDRVGQ